jgi:hypothetical protein
MILGTLTAPYPLRVVTNLSPAEPIDPSPEDGAGSIPSDGPLCWTGGDPDVGDTVMYHVYLDTVEPPAYSGTTVVNSSVPSEFVCYDIPEPLEDETVYYWNVIAEDNDGLQVESETWSFETGDSPVEVTTWGAVKALYRR